MATGKPASLNGTYTINNVETGGPVGTIKGETGSLRHIATSPPGTQSPINSRWEIKSMNGNGVVPGTHTLTIQNMYTIDDTSVGEVHAELPGSNEPQELWVITEFDSANGSGPQFIIENQSQTKGWMANPYASGVDDSRVINCDQLQNGKNDTGFVGVSSQAFEIVVAGISSGNYKMLNVATGGEVGHSGSWIYAAVPANPAFNQQQWVVEQDNNGFYKLSIDGQPTTWDPRTQLVILSLTASDYTPWEIIPFVGFGRTLYIIQTADGSCGWTLDSANPGATQAIIMDCKPLVDPPGGKGYYIPQVFELLSLSDS